MWSFFTPKEKLIFLSGIFEGEGSFGYYSKGINKTNNIECSITMSDYDIIQKFYKYFKKGSVYETKPRKKNYKKLFRYKVTGVEALKIIHLMIPYLGKRRVDNYYGMVQSIRNGSKNRSTYLLQPSEDKTSNVRCSTYACTKNGSRTRSLSRQAS